MVVKNVSRQDHILKATSIREESSNYVSLPTPQTGWDVSAHEIMGLFNLI